MTLTGTRNRVSPHCSLMTHLFSKKKNYNESLSSSRWCWDIYRPPSSLPGLNCFSTTLRPPLTAFLSSPIWGISGMSECVQEDSWRRHVKTQALHQCWTCADIAGNISIAVIPFKFLSRLLEKPCYPQSTLSKRFCYLGRFYMLYSTRSWLQPMIRALASWVDWCSDKNYAWHSCSLHLVVYLSWRVTR